MPPAISTIPGSAPEVTDPVPEASPAAPPYWLDAQLPPQLAPWLTATFGVPAFSAAFLGDRDATDEVIFEAARLAGAVIVSKDSDFLERVVVLHG